jgi:hypothetical protein
MLFKASTPTEGNNEWYLLLGERVKKPMKKEKEKILVVLVAVMLILSCLPSGMAFAQGTTPTPTITTPVYTTNTSVSGTSVDSADISLAVNSGTALSATAGSNGNWTVTAPTLATGDNISVTAQVYGENISQAATATVVAASQPSTGGLSVSITGLPAGVSASVTVSPSSGSSQAVTASDMLSGISVGNCTITANNVTSGNTTYTPSQSTQTVNVVVGQTASASISYAASQSTTANPPTVSPSSLTFQVGNNLTAPPAQTLTITGTSTSTFTVSSSSGWLIIPSTQAQLPITVSIGVNPSGFATGSRQSGTIIIAATDGSFSLGVPVSVIVTTSLPSNPTPTYTSTPFSDVPSGYWATQAIAVLQQQGVIGGFPDGTFHPDDFVTRAQWASLLTKKYGLSPSASAPSFSDVDSGDWFCAAIQAAGSLIPYFSDGTFRPDAIITRQDATVSLVEAAGWGQTSADPSVLSEFSDASSFSPNLQNAVAISVKEGLIEGFPDGTFRPQGQLTRAEAADILYRAQQGTTNEVLPGAGQSPTSSGKLPSQPPAPVSSGGSAGGSEQVTLTGKAWEINVGDNAWIYTNSGISEFMFTTNAVVTLNGQPTSSDELGLLQQLKENLSVSAILNEQNQIISMNVTDGSSGGGGQVALTGTLVDIDSTSAGTAWSVVIVCDSQSAEIPLATNATLTLNNQPTSLGELRLLLLQNGKLSVTAYLNGQGEIASMSASIVQSTPSTGIGSQQ